MQDTPHTIGFTAGELSPWLSTRYDLQRYARGAAKLENFMVQPFGGLRRRGGTKYLGDAASQTAYGVKLIPFYYSETDALMLEFYPGGMRVYRNGSPVKSGSTVYVLSTPWTTVDMVQSIRVSQVNDVLYITTPYSEPRKLARYSDTSWKLTLHDMEPYPRETQASQDGGLQVLMEKNSLYATLISDSSAPAFTADMVSKEYVIAEAPLPSRTLFMNKTYNMAPTEITDMSTLTTVPYTVYYVKNSTTGHYEFYTCYRTYTPDNFSGDTSPLNYPNFFFAGAGRLELGKPYVVNKDWEIQTNGEWNAEWELWRSYDSAAVDTNFYRWRWTRIKTFGQNAYEPRQNWAISGSEERPCYMLLVCRSSSTYSIPAYLHFRILGASRDYKFRIVGYTNAHTARAYLETQHYGSYKSFYTRKWSFGAFGSRNGYPRFSAFYQGRLWFGGTAGLPTTLYASAVDDYSDFGVRSTDDSALHLTLATDDQSRICWLSPSRHLLMGTTDSEWTLTTPDGSGISASNASFSRQSSVGSENKPVCGMENAVFFVQRGAKRLRELAYRLEADGYTSTDISLMAEHLFTAGVREWVVQRGTDSHLWVLMNDGSLAVLTSNGEEQVRAWQRVTFPGRTVLHIASIVSTESNEDEMWFVIRNDTSNRISLERMVNESDCMDGLCTVTAGSSTALSGGAHLAGLQGWVYAQGQPENAQAVSFDSSGNCTVSGIGSGIVCCLGANYASELQTMPSESELNFNTKRQMGRVKLRLLNSSPNFEYCAAHAARWEVYDPAREMLSYPYSGAVRVSQIPETGEGQGFCLRVSGTLGFNLLALTYEIDSHGR